MDSQAFILINLALVFYTVGVWGERLQGVLQWWHIALFLAGIVCDSWGTGLMFSMAGGMTFDIHGISGFMAIVLMLIHGLWALIVQYRKDDVWRKKFHRFSVFVWLIWLVPYFSPMFFALAVD